MYNVNRSPATHTPLSGQPEPAKAKRERTSVDVEMTDVSASRHDNPKRACAGGVMNTALRASYAEGAIQIITDIGNINTALAGAGAHIGKSRQAHGKSSNPHVKSAAGMLNRTLCLANRFNQGASTLTSFAAPAKGTPGHYIRSFAHDLLVGERTAPKQEAVMAMMDKTGKKHDRKKLAANSGHIPNAQSFQFHTALHKAGGTAREEPLASRPRSELTGPADLYDASLKYRVEAGQYIARELSGATHLTVGAHNDYPNVMVHFELEKLLTPALKEDLALPTARASFHEFLMSHYTGIVNAEAAKRGLTTPTVERSSFGHLTPSVAPTGDSFRINLGMMPPAYAEAHASALKILDSELSGLVGCLGQRHTVDPDRSNFAASAHAKALDNANSSVDLAFTKADSSNKTLLFNTLRSPDARNAVNAKAYREHVNLPIGEHGDGALNGALNDLLSKATFSKKGQGDDEKSVLTTVADPGSYDMAAAARPAHRSSDDMEVDMEVGMKVDTHDPTGLAGAYDSYLGNYRMRLASIPVRRPGGNEATDQHMRAIAGTLHAGNPHIATSLDLANQLLMVHALDRMSKAPPSADLGYGSESEVEDADKIAGNKIITHNGMRSLLTAAGTARALLFDKDAGKIGIAYDHPYFETQGGIKDVDIDVQEVKNRAAAGIVVKDINACVDNGEPHAAAPGGIAAQFPKAKAWIIDTTSASTAQMQNVYQQFKAADEARLLYFSSSGLKNEQGGADNNNYGTTRVFAKPLHGKAGKEVVGEVLGGIEKTDRGLVKFSHEYRRSMKAMGLVPNNDSIVHSRSVVSVDESFSGGH